MGLVEDKLGNIVAELNSFSTVDVAEKSVMTTVCEKAMAIMWAVLA